MDLALNLIAAVAIISATIFRPEPPVIAAAIASVGAFITVWTNRVLSNRQRRFELLQDHLLVLVNDCATTESVLTDAGDEKRTIGQISKPFDEMSGRVAKAECVVGAETIKKLYKLNIEFAPLWYEVVKCRMVLDSCIMDLKSTNEQISQIDSRMRAYFESDRPDRADQLRGLSEMRDRLMAELDKSLNRRRDCAIMLMAAIAGARANFNLGFTRLKIAARNELEKADRGRWRVVRLTSNESAEFMQDYLNKMAKIQNEFHSWSTLVLENVGKKENPFGEVGEPIYGNKNAPAD